MGNYKISKHMCEALRQAISEGVAGVRIAEALGVTDASITRHRWGRCLHRDVPWVYTPEEKLRDSTKLLDYYNNPEAKTGAQRVEAHRLREKLRRMISDRN